MDRLMLKGVFGLLYLRVQNIRNFLRHAGPLINVDARSNYCPYINWLILSIGFFEAP